MFQWHNLPINQKRNILDEASISSGYPMSVIEKDWWVIVALKAVFSTPWAANLVFKGGTSLSKAWNLIKRFSEDIDLAMDRSVFGFNTEELSKNQIGKLREKSAEFMESTFMPVLHESILSFGINPESFNLTIKPIPARDIEPRIIMLNYQSIVASNEYIQERVLIEIGARSLREPCQSRPVISIISDIFPGQPFADYPFSIETVHPERTFLEKVCLLHEEFSKEPEKRRHERLSRHLYDVYRIKDTEYGYAALENRQLFETIIAHREKYAALRGITYDRHTYSEIDFIPPNDVIELWRDDYAKMSQTMIYGDSPTFDELIAGLKDLRNRFRTIR